MLCNLSSGSCTQHMNCPARINSAFTRHSCVSSAVVAIAVSAQCVEHQPREAHQLCGSPGGARGGWGHGGALRHVGLRLAQAIPGHLLPLPTPHGSTSCQQHNQQAGGFKIGPVFLTVLQDAQVWLGIHNSFPCTCDTVLLTAADSGRQLQRVDASCTVTREVVTCQHILWCPGAVAVVHPSYSVRSPARVCSGAGAGVAVPEECGAHQH
jgi:hypothetical protein